MGKVKYSKKTTPPSISSSRLKKSVCIILPRIDVTEFLRERRRRSLSLQQTVSSPSNQSGTGIAPSVIQPTAVRVKRRFKLKKEPPCIFHSQIDINDDVIAEEIPGVLRESVCDSICVHDITKSMCYMCSPHPESKDSVWSEINTTRSSSTSEYRGWHVPTPFTPNATNGVSGAQNIGERAINSNSVDFINVPIQNVESSSSSQIDSTDLLNTTEIGVGTGNDLNSAVEKRDQSTQTVRYYSCKQCLALFSDVGHLLHHKTVHQKMFECPFCTANFISKNDLKSHMKLHMLPKYYDCVYCRQAFTKKHDIREHLALHAEQKQFKCQQCPARFQQKTNLRNHEESHKVNKFIHIFKPVDQSSTSTSPSKTGKRSEGSASNQQVSETSVMPISEGNTAALKPNPPRRLVSGLKQNDITITSRPLKSTLPLIASSYLAMASISNMSSTSNNIATSTSAGPSTHISSSTNKETDVLPENHSVEIQRSNPNFFQCPFCPLSCARYRSFKAHSICHTRKSGKFACTICGGKFTKKSGLFFHMRGSHTSG